MDRDMRYYQLAEKLGYRHSPRGLGLTHRDKVCTVRFIRRGVKIGPKGFYEGMVSFMSRSPAMVMVIEGPEETFAVVRSMMGTTNPREAATGTIRGDLGTLFTENLVHGSDSQSSADREIGIFFPGLAG